MPETLLRRRTRQQQLQYTGQQLRRYRKEAKLTVQQLALKAGVTRQIIYHCEKAENFISMEPYIAICQALELPVPPLT